MIRLLKIVIVSCFYSLIVYGQGSTLTPVEIEGLGDSKICPVIYKQGIVFMSNARRSVIKTVHDETGAIPFSLYYQKIFNAINVGGGPELFSEQLTTEYNDGPVCFAKDESYNFYARNSDVSNISNAKRNRALGIFIAKKDKGERWYKPVAFKYNRPDCNMLHPAANKDGSILVFASDMPGGYGGYDLYLSLKDHLGDWTKPRNLGTSVNSSGNELFPSFFKDEWLLFSSDGKGGRGGLDVYKSHWEEDLFRYGSTVTLDSSINSVKDDFGITLKDDGLSGYIGSDRNGSDQIYYFEKALPVFKDCLPDKAVNFCYLIRENNILEDNELPLKYVWDLGDGTSKYGLHVRHCYSGLGSYTASLSLIDTIENETYFNVSEVHIDIKLENRPYIKGPDSVRVNDYAPFKADLSGIDGEPQELYWNFYDGAVQMQEEVDRSFGEVGPQKVLLGIVDVNDKFTCVSKTVEVVDLNTTVTNYNLVKFHKEKAPIEQTKKLGYTVELLNSIKKEALSDSIFMEVNYPITERFDEVDSIYQYTVGESDKVASLYQLYKEMRELGFESKVVSFELNYDVSIDNKEVLIFFSPGKDEITAYNESNLNSFSRKLNSDSKLEVLGYADPKGSLRSNKKLSYRRAKNVASYLEKCGVPQENITLDALGEVRVSDGEAELLRYYRKVEVRLIEY